MKKIQLTNGGFTLVDDEDYEWVSQWNWQLKKALGYAIRCEYVGTKNGKTINKHFFLHREILKTPPGKITDHINRNKLDNRKCNLRIVSPQVNSRNRSLSSINTSGYTGITKGYKGKFNAFIEVNGKGINLGDYYNLQYALLARKWGELYYWERRLI